MSLSMQRSASLRLGQLWRLAWKDLWHERWLAFCTACVLAATLAPLWTLWGLEQGVIGTLIQRQNSDPIMRQILPEGSGGKRFDEAWFNKVKAWPEVGFVVPSTRAIASQVDFYAPEAAAPQRVDLVPTAESDPFLGDAALPEGNGVLLSQPAANRLGVQAGATIQMALERRRNGQMEQAAVELHVIDVLPLAQLDTMSALTSLAFVEAVQGWRDGYVVEAFGSEGSGPLPKTQAYPLFRIHATSIQEVEPLVARLESEGIYTHSRVREVAATLSLQRNLRVILLLIGSITCAGAIVALCALQLATVRRKRREYALLKLTGHGRSWLMALPCVQAAVIALGGAVLALLFYLMAATLINLYFSDQLSTGEAAVHMPLLGIAAGTGIAVVLSMLPAMWGGWRASCVEAADDLREQ